MHTNIISLLISILLLELFIGGSGQVFTLFGIPARQILFAVLMLIFIIEILIMRINIVLDEYSLIIICLIAWALSSTVIGLLRGHDREIIFSDISPMMYFLLYFPLSIYMKKYNIHYQYVFKLLVFSSFVVSVSILLAYVLLNMYFSGNVHILSSAVENTLGKEIFWYRNDGFIFYSGLFYVLFTSVILFGKIISAKKCSNFELLVYIIGLVSIVISMTKGLIISLFVGHLLVFFSKKYSINTRLFAILFSVVFVSIILVNVDFTRFTQLSTDTGVINRLQVIEESLVKINEAVIFGNGFGTELPTKKFHQENSFLDILVEQGLVGLFLYFFLIFIIFYKNHVNSNLVMAVLATVLMSFTNPAINNPLGIGVLILALIFTNPKRDSYFLGKL